MNQVSVIVLSWNRKVDIKETLINLKEQTVKPVEVIVVDQGSDDGTLDMLEKDFLYVKLIKLHRNFGVPGGRNVGAANAKGNILLFLDNDANLAPNAIELTIQKFKNNPMLGALGYKIVNAFTNDLDYSSWPYQKSKLKNVNEPFETYTFCGCGHAIPKKVFEEVGYYWDDLFFSWEESELSIKILDKGYKILYDPSIKVYHRLSSENRTYKTEHECRRLRNSLWVSWKYFPIHESICETFNRFCAYMLKAVINRCFFKMLFSFVSALSRISLLWAPGKVSFATMKRYRKLSNKGNLWSILGEVFSK